jgi:hypothetical protein
MVGVAGFEPAASSSRTERARSQNRCSRTFSHVRASWVSTITASDRAEPQLASDRCSHSAPKVGCRWAGMLCGIPELRVHHATSHLTDGASQPVCVRRSASARSRLPKGWKPILSVTCPRDLPLEESGKNRSGSADRQAASVCQFRSTSCVTLLDGLRRAKNCAAG